MSKDGAGFLVFKKIDDEIKVLGLVSPVGKIVEKGGVYDIPKGGKLPGETDLECAKRECFEECGIKILDREIIGPGTKIGTLMLYPAFTSSDPIIMPNPKSGIIEHSGWEWLDSIDLINNCQLWLREIIIACLESIEK
jgi:8-oxo-dGTP pyrophosphatase MutT (NUDIX family)